MRAHMFFVSPSVCAVARCSTICSRADIVRCPIRAVFMRSEVAGVRVMMSVSKRHFKRAVMRNAVKRQLCEAYRLQKELLLPLADF